jgi:hypothetical protein
MSNLVTTIFKNKIQSHAVNLYACLELKLYKLGNGVVAKDCKITMSRKSLYVTVTQRNIFKKARESVYHISDYFQVKF